MRDDGMNLDRYVNHKPPANMNPSLNLRVEQINAVLRLDESLPNDGETDRFAF
jgi:hypothetical protein